MEILNITWKKVLEAIFRLCAHEVVSERFHDSQNANDMNYKNSHRMTFLVFVVRRGLCCFLLNYINKSGAFRNNSE